MRSSKLTVIAAGGVLLALVAATFVLSGPAVDVQADADLDELNGEGPLDGLVFAGRLGLEGKPADIEDNLIFADGLFVSEQCELECNFPPRPYFVREVDNALEFISETRCPHKDATIVWRGRVKDGRIEGEATWTLHRWYWTMQKRFRFDGAVAETTALVTD